MLKITSKSQINKKKFDLNDFKNFFFEKEKKKKFKLHENLKLESSFWKNNFKIKKKLILVSGLSRSGNHLLLSILDGHPDINFCAGEDGMLFNIFSLAKKYGPKNIEKKIKKLDEKFYLKLSGCKINNEKIYLFDKWLKVKNLKRNSKINHSGTQGQNYTAILDYKNTIPKLNHKGFKIFLKKNNKQFKNIFEFIFYYLDGKKKLFNEVNYKKKFYCYAHSGMRREVNFLLKNNLNVKNIVPFRDFKSFYFSYLKGIYKTETLSTRTLNDIWENWRHKMIDYLLLKKKYPKNIILVSYEDLVKEPLKTINKILKSLELSSLKKIETTTLGKANYGNSSFSIDKIEPGKIYKRKNKKNLTNNQLPREYLSIMKLLKINKI